MIIKIKNFIFYILLKNNSILSRIPQKKKKKKINIVWRIVLYMYINSQVKVMVKTKQNNWIYALKSGLPDWEDKLSLNATPNL